MTTVAELLAELRGQGFALAAEGTHIRITPAARLTAELREVICRHKAELLAALEPTARFLVNTRGEALDVTDALNNLPADPGELQDRVDAMTADPTWASRWAKRLKGAKCADLDAVRRTAADMVGLAAERHRAGDITGFRSWAQFALDHTAGRHWDEAARRPVTLPLDVQIITEAKAVATFADAEAVRQRRRPRPHHNDAR